MTNETKPFICGLCGHEFETSNGCAPYACGGRGTIIPNPAHTAPAALLKVGDRVESRIQGIGTIVTVYDRPPGVGDSYRVVWDMNGLNMEVKPDEIELCIDPTIEPPPAPEPWMIEAAKALWDDSGLASYWDNDRAATIIAKHAPHLPRSPFRLVSEEPLPTGNDQRNSPIAIVTDGGCIYRYINGFTASQLRDAPAQWCWESELDAYLAAVAVPTKETKHG